MQLIDHSHTVSEIFEADHHSFFIVDASKQE